MKTISTTAFLSAAMLLTGLLAALCSTPAAAQIDAGVADVGSQETTTVPEQSASRPSGLSTVATGPNQHAAGTGEAPEEPKPEISKDNTRSPGTHDQGEIVPRAPSPNEPGSTSIVDDLPNAGDMGTSALRSTPVSFLFALLLFLMFLAYSVRRGREALPTDGLVPVLLRGLHVALRLAVFVVGAAVVVRVLAPQFSSTVGWVAVSAAVALGWSLSLVLPDVVAAVVMVFERRVRKGLWISGDGFEGVVERRGLRAVWIRDSDGDPVAIPNRRMIKTVLLTRDGIRGIHEMVVRVPGHVAAPRARAALHDAVLLSPWVRPVAHPVVQREPQDTDLWRVRANLLDHRYASRFEGELLERVEDLLG